MAEHFHYIPILKGKQGEFKALANLASEAKELLTPLVDIPDIGKYEENESKTMETHLEGKAKNIFDSWGTEKALFIDHNFFDLEKRTESGNHPLAYMLDKLREFNVKAIPTTGIDRDDKYNEAVEDALSKDGRGACIRLLEYDMETPKKTNDYLDSLLRKFSINRSNVHLLLDFRSLAENDVGYIADQAIHFINNLKGIKMWLTLTIAASGYPKDLSSIKLPNKKSYVCTEIPRTAFLLWETLFLRRKEMKRVPSFGDYGICHPELPDDIDPRMMRMSVKLRYTTARSFLIFKGRWAVKHGFDQFNSLCKKMVKNVEFCGKDYCRGDEYMYNCAMKTEGPGNASKWIEACTSHHLTFVGEQVASKIAS